jgi:hypothetical protein
VGYGGKSTDNACLQVGVQLPLILGCALERRIRNDVREKREEVLALLERHAYLSI